MRVGSVRLCSVVTLPIRFSFCDYPFMLNPAVKADVLKVESVFQMRHELQDAFFRALFQGK